MKKTRPHKILVVEDSEALLTYLSEILQLHKYEVALARTFAEAEGYVRSVFFSLAILDIALPDGNGIELLKRIREWRNGVPVIVLTAFSDDSSCVRALKLGADDFIVKPVGAGPLIARIQAVLRRYSSAAQVVSELSLKNGAKAILPHHEIVFRDGRTARLTYKETALLRYLYAKAGVPSGAEELLLNIWKASPAETETTCVSAFPPRSCLFLSDSCIKNLRKPGLRRFFPFFFRSFLWPSSFFCGRPLSRLSLIFR